MLIGNYEVPGFKLHGPGFAGRITATVEAPTDDLSGNTDSTELADKGIKPKQLIVSFSLRFNESTHLTTLVEMVEAREGEDAVKYDIVCSLATALRMRQAQFAGQLSIEPDDNLHCWHISFSLSEFRSVPEVASERDGEDSAETSTTNGNFDKLVQKMEVNQ